jgi:hypothetical protein
MLRNTPQVWESEREVKMARIMRQHAFHGWARQCTALTEEGRGVVHTLAHLLSEGNWGGGGLPHRPLATTYGLVSASAACRHTHQPLCGHRPCPCHLPHCKASGEVRAKCNKKTGLRQVHRGPRPSMTSPPIHSQRGPRQREGGPTKLRHR